MKKLLAALLLLAVPVCGQVYESQPDDGAVDMAGDSWPPIWSNLAAYYTFNDPDNMGWDSAFHNRAESATFSSGDYVSVPDHEAFNHTGGQGLSACVWFDDVGNDQKILFKGGYIDVELSFTTGTNVVWVRYERGIDGDTTTEVSAPFTPGAKTFMCGYFYDPTRKARVSVNGGGYFIDSGDMDYDAPNSSADFRIGANAAGPDFVGKVDQIVTFIDGEPPASDLYNSGAGRDCEWVEQNTTATTCYSMDLSTWGLTDSISGANGTATGTLEASDPLVEYGDAYDLSAVNTPTPTGGAKGYAADFENDSSQYAYVNDNSSFDGDAIGRGFCFWIRPETMASNDYLISKWTGIGSTSDFHLFTSSAGVLTANFADSGGTGLAVSSGSAFLANGTRTFVCAWWDGAGDDKVHLERNADTTIRDSAGTFATSNTGSGAFTVGTYGTNYSDGVIGPVFYYDTGIPDASIRSSLYNGGKGKSCSELTTADKVALVSCWPMSEAGGPYEDAIGSNDLTGVNTPTQAAGLVELPDSGMGVRLDDGDNSYLSNATSPFGSAGPFSVCAWVNGRNFTTDNNIAREYSTSVGWILRTGDSPAGRVEFIVGDGSIVSAVAGNATLNSWHHACGRYTGTTAYACIDTVCGTGVDGGLADSSNQFTVGVGQEDHVVDEIKIWSRDIGPEGMAEDYAAGEGKFW